MNSQNECIIVISHIWARVFPIPLNCKTILNVITDFQLVDSEISTPC